MWPTCCPATLLRSLDLVLAPPGLTRKRPLRCPANSAGHYCAVNQSISARHTAVLLLLPSRPRWLGLMSLSCTSYSACLLVSTCCRAQHQINLLLPQLLSLSVLQTLCIKPSQSTACTQPFTAHHSTAKTYPCSTTVTIKKCGGCLPAPSLHAEYQSDEADCCSSCPSL